MLTNLADIARATGRRVVEVSGWKTRGHGDMGKVETVIVHHTAGPLEGNFPSENTLINGRPDLAGPLAQYGIGRDGTIYVIAAGLCWHAGEVLDPSYTNAHAIGIECENTGTGEDWGDELVTSMRLLCAELAKEFGLGLDRVLGHKEVCKPVGRKTDPDFDMDAFRAALGYKVVAVDGNRRGFIVKGAVTVAALAAALGVTATTLHQSNPAIPADKKAVVHDDTTVVIPTQVPVPTAAPVAPTYTTVVVPAPKATVLHTVTPTWRYGSTGHTVRLIQGKVGTHVDGIFGRRTRAAVIAFQRRHHLKQDGIVGPITRKALGL